MTRKQDEAMTQVSVENGSKALGLALLFFVIGLAFPLLWAVSVFFVVLAILHFSAARYHGARVDARNDFENGR
jgi:uncharacterized membrane protein